MPEVIYSLKQFILRFILLDEPFKMLNSLLKIHKMTLRTSKGKSKKKSKINVSRFIFFTSVV